MRNGRPPVERSRLLFAIDMIRNGATVTEAARLAGVGRDTLRRYRITKRRVAATKEVAVQFKDFGQATDERIYDVERRIAASFDAVIARANIPLIATATAAEMESDRLQAAVRAERLRDKARRLAT